VDNVNQPRDLTERQDLQIEVPRFHLITRVFVQLDVPRSLGRTPWGERYVAGIVSGHFQGPRLHGIVVPGGVDWQVLHADGLTTIDTRYTLQIHDGALVLIANRGVHWGSAERLARTACGELVDPSEFYFRVSAQFETGSPAYAWLNRTLFVGSGARLRDGVVHDLYEVA